MLMARPIPEAPVTPLRPVVVLLLALLAQLVALPATAAPGDAAPGDWQGPQVVDPRSGTAQTAAVAGADGASVFWHQDGSTWVSHRDPGPAGTWSTPQRLPGSLGRGRIRANPLAGGGAVVVAVAPRDAVGTSTRSIWQVSSTGVPSPRQPLPLRDVRPRVFAVQGRSLLVAGTRSDAGGEARAAVRDPAGRWTVTPPFPLARDVVVVTAYFDAGGTAHVLANAVTKHIPDTEQRRGAYPVYEATVRPDGSWGPRSMAVRTFAPGGAIGDANADGDVTLAYVHEDQRSRITTMFKTRPAGSDAWSPPTRVPDALRSVRLGVAGDGSTAILRSAPYASTWQGRLGPDGTLEEWQRLATEADGPRGAVLSVADSGPATVSVVLADAVPGEPGADGGTGLERTWRCLPAEPCERVGDFPDRDGYSPVVLASAPGGEVHRFDGSPASCGGDVLCSWWLAAP